MKARLLRCVVVAAPLIAAGCAMHDVARPGDRTFENETQPVVVAPPPQPVVVPPAPPQVVIPPGQAVVVQPSQSSGTVVAGTPGVTVAGSQMVQADTLEANEVRAQTIYANRIQAPEISGTIHQTGGVRMDRTVSNLRVPTITAGVVYADTIRADRVIADQIYVRELERR